MKFYSLPEYDRKNRFCQSLSDRLNLTGKIKLQVLLGDCNEELVVGLTLRNLLKGITLVDAAKANKCFKSQNLDSSRQILHGGFL